MKTQLVFICDTYGQVFCTRQEAEEHEANHYGLSMEQFKEWKLLDDNMRKAAYNVGACNNSYTRGEFEKADAELHNFLVRHNLTKSEKPSNWRW